MLRRLYAVLGLVLCSWILFGTARVAALPTSVVPLHPSQVGSVNNENCVTGEFGWHFVLPGNNARFVSLSVTFLHAGVVTTFVSVQNSKGADVYTNTADTLLGGTATITGSTPQGYFNLSHVFCDGSVPSPSPTGTATASITPTLTPTATSTNSPDPTPTQSNSPTPTPTNTPQDTPPPTATASPTPISTNTPTPSPSTTPTPTPTGNVSVLVPSFNLPVPITGADDQSVLSLVIQSGVGFLIGLMGGWFIVRFFRSNG